MHKSIHGIIAGIIAPSGAQHPGREGPSLGLPLNPKSRCARADEEGVRLLFTPPPSRWRWRPCHRRHRRHRRRSLAPGQTRAALAALRASGPPPPRGGRGLRAPGSGGRGTEPSGCRSPEWLCAAAGGCDLSAAAR